MSDSGMSEEDVAQYWDENANSWSDQVRKGWDYYRKYLNNPAFLRFIGDLSGKGVLDAGCGEGYNTRLLARSGARMVGVDISRKMIEFARTEEEREPLGIRYEVTSFTDLSLFPYASFDAVVSFMALMDGPDFGSAAREIFRVLRAGGELLFNITHPCFMTKGYGWTTGLTDSASGRGRRHVNDDDPGKLTVSDYFSDQPFVERWKFSKNPDSKDLEPFAIPVFPRTLSEYVNTLIGTGFVLKAIEEPRPSEEACKEHPWLQRWRDHATLFLYIRAAKP
jgi:SAM-dependent methyltransferase